MRFKSQAQRKAVMAKLKKVPIHIYFKPEYIRSGQVIKVSKDGGYWVKAFIPKRDIKTEQEYIDEE